MEVIFPLIFPFLFTLVLSGEQIDWKRRASMQPPHAEFLLNCDIYKIVRKGKKEKLLEWCLFKKLRP